MPQHAGNSTVRPSLAAPLDQRLRAIAPHLNVDAAPARQTGDIALDLAATLRRGARADQLWLAIIGFTAVFPTIDEHAAVRRALALTPVDDPAAALTALLEAVSPVASRSMAPDAPLVVVADAVVLDANFTGRFDHNTGVQRVLRETASRWSASHDITLVCWNDEGTAMRRLAGTEITRVTDWATHTAMTPAERLAADVRPADETIVVPFRSVIVEIEVSQPETSPPLAALAAVSGNRVALVGHDAIPIVSAESQDPGEIERFARFLTVVKHSARVAGVSRSAATEFAGFVDAVSAQGVTGPEVVAVPLAMNAPSARALAAVGDAPPDARPTQGAASTHGAPAEPPLILVVGSQEPRKNHSAIVFAAGRMQAAGLSFRLRFIGGAGSAAKNRFDAEIRVLRATGANVEVLRGASDTVLLDSYRQARFTVFPSLHEGFGLPVAESLALGVPVITSNHGSLLEAAEGGGCLVVDARDDEALYAAMSALLTDEALHQRLRAEAVGRTFRTWDDYARDLWAELVLPVQAGLVPPGIRDSVAAPAAEPRPAALSRRVDATVSTWFTEMSTETLRLRAYRTTLRYQASRVVPLARFFVLRSREMGVVPAGRAAIGVVRRRLIGR